MELKNGISPLPIVLLDRADWSCLCDHNNMIKQKWDALKSAHRALARHKLGRNPSPPEKLARRLHLKKYLLRDAAGQPILPAPPDTLDLTMNNCGQSIAYGMDGNDTLGDCTAAGVDHIVQTDSLDSGNTYTLTDSDVIAFYRVFSPAPADNGANLLDVLSYWRSTGICGHQISAYVAVDPANAIEVRQAMFLFGALYAGVSLPDSVCNVADLLAAPWDDSVTDPADPDNGHCIAVVAADGAGIKCVTWGAVKPLSNQFCAAYCDEVYAVITPDWFTAATQKTPEGFDLATLQADLAAIAGGVAP
jgi:hypothetical protein